MRLYWRRSRFGIGGGYEVARGVGFASSRLGTPATQIIWVCVSIDIWREIGWFSRSWPVLEQIRPNFGELGHFCCDFRLCSVTSTNSSAIAPNFRQAWTTLGRFHTHVRRRLSKSGRISPTSATLESSVGICKFESYASRGARIGFRSHGEPPTHLRRLIWVVSRPALPDRPKGCPPTGSDRAEVMRRAVGEHMSWHCRSFLALAIPWMEHCLELARTDQIRPDARVRPHLARIRPNSGKPDRSWHELGHLLPSFGQTSPVSAEFDPTSAKFCPESTDIGRLRPKLGRFAPWCLAVLDQTFAHKAKLDPSSVEFGPLSCQWGLSCDQLRRISADIGPRWTCEFDALHRASFIVVQRTRLSQTCAHSSAHRGKAAIACVAVTP